MGGGVGGRGMGGDGEGGVRGEREGGRGGVKERGWRDWQMVGLEGSDCPQIAIVTDELYDPRDSI